MAVNAGSALDRARTLIAEHPDQALKAVHRALAVAQHGNDPAWEARARAVHARLLCELGQTEHASQEAQSALRLAQRSGDPAACAEALTSLGGVHTRLGRHAEAIDCLERAVERARPVRDGALSGQCIAALGLGYLAHARALGAHGDEGARTVLRAGIAALNRALRPDPGLPPALAADALGCLAQCHAEAGEAAAAEPCLEAALALAAGDPARRAALTAALGELRWRQGRMHEARDLLEAATSAPDLPAPLAMQALRTLTGTYEALGDLAAALRAFRRYHHAYARRKADDAQRLSRAIAAQLETEQAKHQAAMEHLRAETLERTHRSLSVKAEELARASFEDPLTGLFNRRRLDAALEGMAHERRPREPFALALLDIDRFKAINDTYSHLVGDEVLRRVGGLLRQGCRHEDLPARYGGEEFALVLHGVDRATAAGICERLRAAIETHGWQAIHPKLAVTASIGLAHAEEMEDVAALLALADARLYAAKRGGRNRVVSSNL